jgi:uncharacterized protein
MAAWAAASSVTTIHSRSADRQVASAVRGQLRPRLKGRLINLDTESGKRIYGAMKEGEFDGQSIWLQRGRVHSRHQTERAASHHQVDQDLPEVSLVTFPMNDLARTAAVKATETHTIRDFENFLREVGGFSHAAAKSIAQHGFKTPESGPKGLLALAASLRDLRHSI